MVAQKEDARPRIVVIDALRGFALLGILLAHVIHWFAAGPLPEAMHSAGALPVANVAAPIKIPEFINAGFITNKFYPLFTFIFGFSFFLQTNSFKKHFSNIDIPLLRRAFFLFLIGVVHHMLWMGDILMMYALLMLPLILLRRISDTALLVIALLFTANVPGILFEFLQVAYHTRHVAADDSRATWFLHVISQGSWKDIITFDYYILPGKFKFQAMSGRLFFTLGFFMMGMLAGRRGWLKNPLPRGRSYQLLIASFFMLVGLQYATYKLNYEEMSDSFFEIAVGNLLIFCQSVSAVCFYTSLITVLFYYNAIHWLFNALAGLGRMALTSYLLQTAIGLMLFYHVGFGLFRKTSQNMNIVIGLGIFAIQLLLSALWFRYFNFGIVEWLLRGGTFLKFQRLRKKMPRPELSDVMISGGNAAITNSFSDN